MTDEAQTDTPTVDPAADAGPVAVAPAPVASAAPVVTKTDEIVDRWFRDFPGTVVTDTTEQWNFLYAAKERLKEMLNQ